MRKTMRHSTQRKLEDLRSRIGRSEAAGAAINPRAYELQQRLERQLEADTKQRQRLRDFLESRL
jgi:hypothetical protein